MRNFYVWLISRPLVVLLGVIATVFAIALFNHPLVSPMEPRFAEVVREMVAQGQYLVPIKNGVPYVEYPPLFYWLGLLGHLAGLPITAAVRLPAYVAFVLWIAWLPRLQRQLFPDWPRILLPLTAAVLPSILYQFFTAETDGLLILGTLIAFSGYVNPRSGFNWELWGGIALATLAKGPVGLVITLPAMGLDILIVNAFARGGVAGLWRRVMAIKPWRGIGLVLLLNAPWYIATGFVVGWDFIRAVFVYQNMTRFLVGFDHVQPWWYYSKTIIYDMFPLSLLFPIGVVYGAVNLRRRQWRVPLLWAFWTLLFFSLSQSKQGKYIMPAAPAVAMLALAATACFSRWVNVEKVRAGLRWWAVGILVIVTVFVIGVLPFLGGKYAHEAGYQRLQATLQAQPGKVVSYGWPRARLLFELGTTLPHVRSARDLYQSLRDGEIGAGDYVLVNRNYLPKDDKSDDSMRLAPAPGAPYFEKVGTYKVERTLVLFRVLAGADRLPMPATPTPPPQYWWEKFDTD